MVTPTQPKKRKPIKLTCIALFLLIAYTLFVWMAFTLFHTHGVHDDEDVGRFGAFRLKKNDGNSASGNSGSSGTSGTTDISKLTNPKKEPQPKPQPQQQPQQTKKWNPFTKSSFNYEEITALLTGELLQNLKVDEIQIKKPKAVGVDKKEGLGDIRPWMDVVESVFAGAEFGDRVYDGDSTGDTNSEGDGTGAGGTSGVAGGRTQSMPILTAYAEPINQTAWKTKPLPIRPKSELIKITYPHLNSCMKLTSQFPIDAPPTDLDPFLPWIHDVFPSPDGKNVVFVAQNRRRCYNGQRFVRGNEVLPEGVIGHKGYIHVDPGRNYFMRPQAALFQHVPVKQVDKDGEEPRYRLSSHEEADDDGMETRFICRFKQYNSETSTTSIVGYSLSTYELDYDYHTFRKGYLRTHSEAGYDNHVIWTSQLLFKCPIPDEYHDLVASGDSVTGDYATLYVDVVPIRTGPRYTPPREFLPPRYKFTGSLDGLFVANDEWGKEHILPKIEESGRWENIPICMPSLLQHEVISKSTDLELLRLPNVERPNKRKTVEVPMPEQGVKIHKVIACTWASATFRTRGNRAKVGDGERRLMEWLEFHLLAGFDHVYVYDNSGAFTNEDSLAGVINRFPGKVTRVDWPCKICSNLDGNQGERSSQYAAESSCRLRFGVHAKWLGSVDTDEYLIPMGSFTNMADVSEYLDRKGMYVAEFKSSPAKPRFNLLDNPINTEEGHGKFTPTVKDDETFLHTYNCNWEQFPRENTLTHRSKQMYRADFIKLHYVHYATATVVSQMTEEETRAAGLVWKHKYKEGHLHQFFEVNEATMLHTKSKVAQNTLGWKDSCKQFTRSEHGCNLGFPFPIGADPNKVQYDENGWAYNCFINEKVENYWWPRLVEAIKARG